MAVEVVEIKIAVPFNQVHRERIIPFSNAAGNHHFHGIGFFLLRQRHPHRHGPGKLLQRNTHPFLEKLGQVKNLLNGHVGGDGNSNHHKASKQKVHANPFH